MHIHLPKPLHGWREFLGEVGIIVVGVLIALGAEQIVESIHWDHEVAAERASLLQEAKDSLDGVAVRRKQQPCVDRRLAEIKMALERHKRGEAVGVSGRIGYPLVQWATRGSWQIALSGQALSHMKHDDKIAFSDLFGAFDFWDRLREQERQTWYRLSMLNTPDLLSEQEWGNLAAAYNEAVMRNEHVRLLAPFVLAKKLPGIKDYRVNSGYVLGFTRVAEEICQPVLAPAPAGLSHPAGRSGA
jgi:hypothetical protein